MINKDYLNRVLSNDELHSKIIGNSWTVFKFSTEPISIPTNYFFWLEQDERVLLRSLKIKRALSELRIS